MRRLVGMVAVAALVGSACVGDDPVFVDTDGGSVGLPDAASDDAAPDDAGPIDDLDAATGDAGDGDPFSELDAGVQPCDPKEAIPADALHVAGDALPGGDGSAIAPFQNLAQALASRAGAKYIVLAEGTYATGKLSLTGSAAGTTIRGGYVRSGAEWSKNCASGSPARTLLSSTDAVAIDVLFGAEAAPITIENVTLATKVQGATLGTTVESVYALLVHGTGTKVVLRGVHVHAGRGGSAVQPAQAPAATARISCDGLTTCSNGAIGAPAKGIFHATAPGTYALQGFVPANGGTGSSGNPGTNGSAGGEDPGVSSCAICGGDPCQSQGTDPNVYRGSQGRCGCAGQGGAGGKGGGGGGASIGVFASGTGVEVRLEAVAIVTTGGGDGAAGGLGALGAAGAAGTSGTKTQCAATCTMGGQGACEGTYKYSNGGAAGGTGGKGSQGGQGGSGAGGDSYGTVSFKGATIAIVPGAVAYKVGPAGKGGPGSVEGEAGIGRAIP